MVLAQLQLMLMMLEYLASCTEYWHQYWSFLTVLKLIKVAIYLSANCVVGEFSQKHRGILPCISISICACGYIY